MNTENVILWLCAVVIWLLIAGWVLWGFAAVKVIARWIGNKVADFGGGGPR